MAETGAVTGGGSTVPAATGGGSSVPAGSSTQGNGAPRGGRTNQGTLLREVLKNFTVEKFAGAGGDYDDWSWKMLLYFRQIGLLQVMTGAQGRPSDEGALRDEWDERSSAGYYLLSQSLEISKCRKWVCKSAEGCIK